VIPSVIAAAIAFATTRFGWRADARLTGDHASVRAILAAGLLAAATWLSAVIVTSEYWFVDDLDARFLFRVIAVFVVLSCMPTAIAVAIATIGAAWTTSSIRRWRLCLLPALAFAMFALAVLLVDAHQFFPAA
jgi:hypothetical protein